MVMKAEPLSSRVEFCTHYSLYKQRDQTNFKFFQLFR